MTKPALSYSLLDTEFLFSSFLIHFEATETVTLPANRGSAFRGAFGRAFRRIECRAPNSDCGDCLLDRHCIFNRYFARRNPGDRVPVRPYIFEHNNGIRQYNKGDKISFIFTLVGESIDFLPLFLVVFEEMAWGGLGRGRGRCVLKEIVSLGDDYPKTLYKQNKGMKILGEPIRRTWSEFFQGNPPRAERVYIRFITPTRIIKEGRLVDELPFDLLISRLILRISDLDREYCGGGLEIPFQELLGRARESVEIESQNVNWSDWERYSGRQETRMKLGGLVGEVTYKGEVDLFLPYLHLGEYVHVGKQSTFGNGMIKVEAG